MRPIDHRSVRKAMGLNVNRIPLDQSSDWAWYWVKDWRTKREIRIQLSLRASRRYQVQHMHRVSHHAEHRVRALCPVCGLDCPAGRIAQHMKYKHPDYVWQEWDVHTAT